MLSLSSFFARAKISWNEPNLIRVHILNFTAHLADFAKRDRRGEIGENPRQGMRKL